MAWQFHDSIYFFVDDLCNYRRKKNFFLFGSYGLGGKHMFPYGNTGRITGHFFIDMVFYHINLRLASDFEKQFSPCQWCCLKLVMCGQCFFQLSRVGGIPPPQNPKFPQENTQNTENIKNGIEFIPPDMCFPLPRTWSLELTQMCGWRFINCRWCYHVCHRCQVILSYVSEAIAKVMSTSKTLTTVYLLL